MTTQHGKFHQRLHDIRSPLSVVMALLQDISDGYAISENELNAGVMSVREIGRILDELMDNSKSNN